MIEGDQHLLTDLWHEIGSATTACHRDCYAHPWFIAWKPRQSHLNQTDTFRITIGDYLRYTDSIYPAVIWSFVRR